jgi:hypothetical protein
MFGAGRIEEAEEDAVRGRDMGDAVTARGRGQRNDVRPACPTG